MLHSERKRLYLRCSDCSCSVYLLINLASCSVFHRLSVCEMFFRLHRERRCDENPQWTLCHTSNSNTVVVDSLRSANELVWGALLLINIYLYAWFADDSQKFGDSI